MNVDDISKSKLKVIDCYEEIFITPDFLHLFILLGHTSIKSVYGRWAGLLSPLSVGFPLVIRCWDRRESHQ
ncbi:unnamed protein product [Allacma fusca]|uniref:Uncharacterized protein n=1 Tax=Allacma fusca TaxID=39272 RepID=A0A8J2PDU7_9HEXA|nr:unnamed protein product [Allacma fusca]